MEWPPKTAIFRQVFLALMVVVNLLSLSSAQAQAPNVAEREYFLRSWIRKNIAFIKNVRDEDVLFARQSSVYVQFYGGGDELKYLAKSMISTLSQAFGLSYDMNSQAPNLFVVVDRNIAESGHPSRALLKKFGLTNEAVEKVVSSVSWTAMCGHFSFSDADGHIAFSAAVASIDSSEEERLRCVVSGILASFGLRSNTGLLVSDLNDFGSYILLAEALKSCDSKISKIGPIIQHQVQDVYEDCISSQFIRNNVSPEDRP